MSEQISETTETTKVLRTLTGKVVSTKMQKTINVQVEHTIKHPKYGKYIKRHRKILAHDEQGVSKEGDWVIIQEGRPISKNKSWRLLKIVNKSEQKEGETS